MSVTPREVTRQAPPVRARYVPAKLSTVELDLLDDPGKRLALAVLHRAVEDWLLCIRRRDQLWPSDYTYPREEMMEVGFSSLRQELEHFFQSVALVRLLDVLGVTPAWFHAWRRRRALSRHHPRRKA